MAPNTSMPSKNLHLQMKTCYNQEGRLNPNGNQERNKMFILQQNYLYKFG